MRRACSQVKPLVNSPFNGTNVRGQHKKSVETYGMGNNLRETARTMVQAAQGSSLPQSGETMAGIRENFAATVESVV